MNNDIDTKDPWRIRKFFNAINRQKLKTTSIGVISTLKSSIETVGTFLVKLPKRINI